MVSSYNYGYNYNSYSAKSYCAQSVDSKSRGNNSAQSSEGAGNGPSSRSVVNVADALQPVAQMMRRMAAGIVDPEPYIQNMIFDATMMPIQEAVNFSIQALVAHLSAEGALDPALSESKNDKVSQFIGNVAFGYSTLDFLCPVANSETINTFRFIGGNTLSMLSLLLQVGSGLKDLTNEDLEDGVCSGTNKLYDAAGTAIGFVVPIIGIGSSIIGGYRDYYDNNPDKLYEYCNKVAENPWDYE